MTPEEKAKAYDEALERAKGLLEIVKEDKVEITEEDVKSLFPELREENNDDRIRNAIIGALRDTAIEGYGNVSVEDMVDWLEKQKDAFENGRQLGIMQEQARQELGWPELKEQKEQKPILEVFGFKVGDAVRLKDGDGRKHIIKSFEEIEGVHGPNFYQVEFEDNSARDGIYPGEEYPNGYYTQMEKFEEEQKPVGWSDDYREEDIQTRFAFYTYKDDPSVLYLSNVFVEETSRNHGFGTRILKAAEKVAEAIGAITICLKVKQDSPANAWYRKRGYSYVAFEDGYDWLEKNLEYLKPAQPAEWSEYEKMLARIIEDTISYLNGGMCFNNSIEELKYRSNLAYKLKSLRPSWKASERQQEMEPLTKLEKAVFDMLVERTNEITISEKQARKYAPIFLAIVKDEILGEHWKTSKEQMEALEITEEDEK